MLSNFCVFVGADGEMIKPSMLDEVNNGRPPNRGCGWKCSY
jgi:hypothetical protein